MKALVLGCNGQLGRALADTAGDGVNLVGLDLPELDVTDSNDVMNVCRERQPTVIINAAAFTAVDKAESEPELAASVNTAGPQHVAAAAKKVGARLIHVSTDFVFDGEASVPYAPAAETNPLSVYGRTKRNGELAVFDAMHIDAAVIRTAWLYSKSGSNFVKTMLRLMSERDDLRVVADQRGTPTWADSLAETVWALAGAPEIYGIYHWTDGGECSWYEFAMAIQQEALSQGLLERAIPIDPITSDDYPAAAKRPRFSVLDSSETVAKLGLQPAPWRANLRRMLKGVTR